MTYKLPEHTVEKGVHDVVLTFVEPLTAADATLVHRHLRGKYPGASIATTGDRLVTVTPVAISRPASRSRTRKT
ncbi:MAG TPA: hypothetical protein VFG96_05750 [Jiangellaceae bacterium]|nr:hypothetical protein [Jiangellaceae bacterium]